MKKRKGEKYSTQKKNYKLKREKPFQVNLFFLPPSSSLFLFFIFLSFI